MSAMYMTFKSTLTVIVLLMLRVVHMYLTADVLCCHTGFSIGPLNQENFDVTGLCRLTDRV